MEKKIKEYLNESEHMAITKFIQDKVMVEAVKKVLMEAVFNQGVLKEGKPFDLNMNYAFSLASRKKMSGFTNLTNEQIGADLCAVWEGTNLVGLGFNELEKFKEVKEPSGSRNNPGR